MRKNRIDSAISLASQKFAKSGKQNYESWLSQSLKYKKKNRRMFVGKSVDERTSANSFISSHSETKLLELKNPLIGNLVRPIDEDIQNELITSAMDSPRRKRFFQQEKATKKSPKLRKRLRNDLSADHQHSSSQFPKAYL